MKYLFLNIKLEMRLNTENDIGQMIPNAKVEGPSLCSWLAHLTDDAPHFIFQFGS